MINITHILKIRKPAMFFIAGLLLFILAGVNNVNGATRTASVTGNWNATATWGNRSVPTAGDIVIINGGITVTVTAPAACSTLTTNNNGGIIITGTNSLAVSGLIRMARPSNNNTNFTITVGAGALSAGSLTMFATTTTRNNIISISTGTVTINGAVVTGTTGCQFNFTGAGTLDFHGAFTSNPVITTFTGSTVIYSYAGDQNVDATIYSNLTLSGSGIKTLTTGTTTINGDFTTAGTATTTGVVGLTIGGNVSIGTGSTFSSGAYTHNVGGSWTNSGTFIATGSTINFNGASDSYIGASSFNNITISGAGIKTATGSITALGDFNLTSGQFRINNSTSNSLTISGNYTQSGGVLDFNAGTTGASNLYLGGNLTVTSGAGSITTVGSGAPNGIINFNGSGVQTMSIVNSGAAIWTKYSIPSGKSVQLLSNITLSSADLATEAIFQGEMIVNGTLNLGTYTVTQDGGTGTAVFTVNSGANLITANADGISGSISATNMTTTYSSGANYEFRGAATGTFTTSPTANTVNNLTINNASGVALSNGLTVAGALTLTSGQLTLGTNNLTLGASSPAVAGTLSASNMVVTNSTGELRKSFSANGSYLFPVGEVTGTAEYSPVTLNFASGTYAAGAYASAKVINAKHPNNASVINYLNRYWIISQSGISSFSTTVTARYLPADIAGTESSQVAGKYSGSLPWIKFATLSANTLTANGVTSFSDFTGINNVPSIVTSITDLTGFSYTVGSGPSVQQSFTISGSDLTADITVTPSTNFEISTTSGSGFVSTPITLTQVGGIVATTTVYVRLKTGLAVGAYVAENVASTSTGAVVVNVVCSGTVFDLPSITPSTTTLSGFTYCVGSGPSASRNFTINGSNLVGTGNIIVAGSVNYLVSTDNVSFNTSVTYPYSGGVITGQPKTVYVRLIAGLSANNYNNEAVTFSGGGLSSPPSIINSGTVYALQIAPATIGASLCVGGTGIATLSASGAVSGDKYIWYDAATAGNLLKTSTDNTDNTYVTPVLGATTNYWVSILNAGGCESSRTQVTATYPTVSPDGQNAAGANSWIGHVYDGVGLDTYIGHYTELEAFDQNFGGDYNCFNITSNSSARSIYAETFSVRYRMNSTKKGLYVVDMGADDGIRLTVDGTLVFNSWVNQPYTSSPGVLMNLTGTSSLAYDYYENGGGNRVVFQNLTSVLSNAINTNTTQSILVGSTGTAISGDIFGTLPTGITLNGTGYQWTYSTTPLGARSNISGATGATYSPNASVAPFNVAGTYYIYRNTSLSSVNNVSPNPYVATNESNAATLTVKNLPAITTSTATLTGFSYTVGSGPSAQQSFTISGSDLTANITVTPSANFEISTTSGSGFVSTPLTLTQTAGTVNTTTIYVRLKAGLAVGTYAAQNVASTSTGATTKNVSCSGTVVNIPLITTSIATLTGFTYNVGFGPSAQQSFTVGGTYLTANIAVTPSTDFEISTTSGSGFVSTPITLTQLAGTVATTTIYVRLKAGLAIGTYAAENIASSSTGAVVKNVACSGTVVVAPLITTSTTTLTGFSYIVGSGPSAQQSFTINGTDLTTNIIVTPSTNFEISTTSGSGFVATPITLTQVGGTVAITTIYVRLKTGLAVGTYAAENIASTSTGAATKNVVCSGTVVNSPLITASTTTLTGFNYITGNGPSAQQTFTVGGAYLTANLIITPSTNLEISTTSGSGFVSTPITLTQTTGTIATTTIYVRLKAGLAIGSYSAENVAMTSTNAITKNVVCSGTVTNSPVITISPTLLTEFSYLIGAGPSSQQSFTVSGVNLIGNIVITPPADYEISLTSGVSFVATNPISFTPTGRTVATTTIFVRLKAGLAGNIYAGENIASASTSATTQNVACSGIVNAYVQIWKGGALQAGYTTLKGAFDAINAGTYTGALEIRINGNITETVTAALYQSGYTGGGGTSNYSSVNIYPTIAGITITGNLAAPLIDLNGADNVTIDGSVNALSSTKTLTITNTSTSNIAGTSTIRFVNSAESNALKYCTIKGSETNASSGVVFFSTATAGNGNDGNTIDNNDITSNATGRPVNAIYSAGTTLYENSGNIILNNNIFDFWNAGASSSAIQLGANTTDFIISRNSFYETTSFIPTLATVNYRMVWLNNTAGNNFTVSNNYMGGQAPLCGGSALLLGTTGTVRSVTLDPIEISAGTTMASSVQGNTIQNISFRSSNAAPFRAINAVAGALNIGTESGNILGSDTGNGSITVTSTIATGNVYGIYIASTNTVNCQNNSIGSITTANISAVSATNLFGIYKTATTGTTTISKNTIGSTTTANSLNTSSTATANSQLLYGIYSVGTGNTTISTNIVANITNSTTETTLASRLRGILTEGGSNDINNNDVHHLLSRGAANGANYPNTSLIGISQVSKLAGSLQNVSGNSVYNLTNTATVKMEMYGIYYDGPTTGTNTISRNFVHTFNISSTDAAYLHGISLYGGAFTASNNIVYLGNTIITGCSMWAMWTNSTNSIRIYHNTLYLGGKAASGASNTYAFRSLNAGPTDAIIKNNILWNNRTNSSNVISHYAIYLQSSANTSVDYNDFRFYQQFGIVGATAYASFAEWKTGTGFDTNSTEADPLLINLGGALPTDYQTSVPLDGVPGTGILTDYNNIVRSTIAPTMGAWEYFSNPVEVWNGTTFRKGYTTLKDAFDKINDGTWTGDLIIKFKGNTIETVPAVLNASGTGLSSYTKILIYPSRLGVTVTGSLAAPLVDLNGCDNVTFDGRKDASGTTSEITFSNTSTSNVAGTSTFRFINDANNNTIKNCTIKGSSTDASAGIVFFSTTTGTTGNDGNTIDNNSITNSADANRPLNVIYSLGTSGKENSGNAISNNNIFNFLNRGTASNGIQLADYNTIWTIAGNSLYETVSFSPTASVAYNAIFVNNTSGTGSGFTVSGNYIGGNAALCGGIAWTKIAAFDNAFTAINLSVGTGTTSDVQNNTIQNFAWGNSLNSAWTGINMAAGSVNIGTSIANIIGVTTGTNSIAITNATTGANVYGINIASTGTIDCQNNIIGSITTANAVGNATNFYGINKTATAGTTTIINNTIGSASIANSINASSTSSGNAQNVYGIYSAGTGNVTISSNTIANLKNTTSNTTAATAGLINGIVSTDGANTIANNIIRNLTIANANNSVTNSAAVCGIALTGNSLKTVTGNTIYNLSNTYASFAGSVIGLNFGGSTGANIVTRNFIHSLTVPSGSTTANLYGIKIAAGATTYSNNIISLGGTTATTIYGIYEIGAANNNNNIYFNTVYISGSLATGITNKSYCLYSVATTNSRDFRNNIFSNARSTTGGASLHYAIYFNYAVATSLTLSNNDYYAPGIGGVLGYYGAANKTALPLITGIDANSVLTNPTFINAGSTVAADYKVGVSLTGVTGLGITIDYGSNSRGTVPTMGAWEGNINKWRGGITTDWNTAGNWTGNTVPPVDASIYFDDVPMRHCVLDQDRSVTNITNGQGVFRMVTNGHKLTVKGNFNFTNGAQIDASSTTSNVVLAGVSAQTIPAGVFYNNEVYDLTVNNANNVTLFGTLRLLHTIIANSGRLDANTNTPIVVYAGTAAQTIENDRYLANNINNLSIDNVSGVALASTAAITVPHDLTITNGVLTVPPGATLTVDDFTYLNYRSTVVVPKIDYWSCLVLQSDATSTGSFIHSDLFSGIGTVKVERYMSHTNNWHLCSSPIKDQSVKDFLKYNPEIPTLFDIAVAPNTIIGAGIRDYSTETDLWNPYVVYDNANTTAGSIGKGKGFSIRTIKDYMGIPGTGTVDATGIPNLNTVNVALTRSGATTDYGWNCIGNPFTSAINVNNGSNGFLNATNTSSLDPGFVAIYLWDTNNITTSHTTPEYVVVNNATSITSVQASQGFFVKSKTGGGSVSFTKAMQSPNATLTFKAAVTEWPSLKIFATNQTSSSSTEIKFITNTSIGLDPGYDAGMLKANPEFALYSKLLDDNAVDFTLQCLPDKNYDQYVIPIGIDFKAGGALTFTAETINLPSGCQAVLEDRLLKRFTRLDLKNAKYVVSLSSDTKGTGRFFLHTAEVIIDKKPIENQSFNVYTIGKTIYINGVVSENARFFLYSVNGKRLAILNAESQAQNTLDASGFPAGVYLLTVIDENQKKSVKFVLEN